MGLPSLPSEHNRRARTTMSIIIWFCGSMFRRRSRKHSTQVVLRLLTASPSTKVFNASSTEGLLWDRRFSSTIAVFGVAYQTEVRQLWNKFLTVINEVSKCSLKLLPNFASLWNITTDRYCSFYIFIRGLFYFHTRSKENCVRPAWNFDHSRLR